MPTDNHFDVIVLGIGSMGSSACYHLAKRGARVLGLEQFDLPHQQGSHHGKSRMIRKAYFEHPDYVPLLQRAYQLWDELEAGSMETILKRTGGLYLCGSKDSIVTGSLASAREHNLPHDFLLHSDIVERFPAFNVPDSHTGFYEPDAGYLRPEEGILEHVRQAREKGATIKTNCPVLNWKKNGEGIEVSTDHGSYFAQQLVVCAGAWTSQMLTTLGIELTVTRQIQAWFEPLEDPAQFSPDSFPCWFIETELGSGHYGFPILPGRPALKIAHHKAGTVIPLSNLGQAVEPPTEAELEELRQILATYIPGAAGPVKNSCTCLYTNSPDQHFIVGKHPDEDRIQLAGGFSGHGYKFSSVIGEILADLAIEGKTRHPIDFLSPERFG